MYQNTLYCNEILSCAILNINIFVNLKFIFSAILKMNNQINIYVSRFNEYLYHIKFTLLNGFLIFFNLFILFYFRVN